MRDLSEGALDLFGVRKPPIRRANLHSQEGQRSIVLRLGKDLELSLQGTELSLKAAFRCVMSAPQESQTVILVTTVAMIRISFLKEFLAFQQG